MNGERDTIFKWDLNEQNSWFNNMLSIKTPKPWTTNTNSAVLLNDTVYFYGMTNDDDKLHAFSISTEQWLNTSSLKQPQYIREYGCMTANDTHLFVVDGSHEDDTNDTVLQIYNTTTNEWRVIILWSPNNTMDVTQHWQRATIICRRSPPDDNHDDFTD